MNPLSHFAAHLGSLFLLQPKFPVAFPVSSQSYIAETNHCSQCSQCCCACAYADRGWFFPKTLQTYWERWEHWEQGFRNSKVQRSQYHIRTGNWELILLRAVIIPCSRILNAIRAQSDQQVIELFSRVRFIGELRTDRSLREVAHEPLIFR